MRLETARGGPSPESRPPRVGRDFCPSRREPTCSSKHTRPLPPSRSRPSWQSESSGERGTSTKFCVGCANDSSLGGIARERAELRSRQVGRLAETLLATAKSAEDTRSQREAYERLAQLDATARQDVASAVLWHRAILELAPAYQPSLRHIE